MLLFDPMYKKEKLWKRIKRECKIAYPTVVLFLTGESKKLDGACLTHLPEFMSRKYADSAVVFYSKDCYKNPDFGEIPGAGISCIAIEENVINELYELYCFCKFYDNAVFTFTSKPKDNLLQRYLHETEVNEDDAACLALYHLRRLTKVSDKQECADV